MSYKVFIDGAEGTTGLKIHEYFQKRSDIELIYIDADKRKDLEERLACVKKADVSFLCLPDGAAKEIAAAAPADCRILDTSTAHRTDSSWVYGMPELCREQRELIRNSNRVAVPGCHATGVILLTRPLIESGIVGRDYNFSAFSLTGYSGGGKKMIAQYESEARSGIRQGSEDPLVSPRQYGIAQMHKHLPEIIAASGMSAKPSFIPVVADYYSGMQVIVPVKGAGTIEEVRRVFREYYEGQPMVSVVESADDGGFIAANRLAGTNRLEIAVDGSDENIILTATYDNLGKGASGAAVQNMNIMLGIEETKGLI
ncbi:MAG: N-acetyl-gamma-glutamyl-phosphate reductase [Bacillota bacterium]|nr:N-acetyl-gamma-glutamyl-phosphate reductase [Bacillota bacterium]